MSRLFAGLAIVAVLIAACSGTTPQSTATPGSGATPGTEATPTPAGGGGQTNPPNAGDMEAKARSLVPDGSTETGHLETGGIFQIYLTNPKSIKDLEAFWDAKIPQTGLTLSGKFEAGGAVTYAFSNPDGGIVASPDSSGNGQTTIVISVGNAT